MNMLDYLGKLTAGTNSDKMGGAVEDMVTQALMRRRPHERRWYDNNFFDDGLHFKVISRKTGKVIDTVSRTSGYVERAIPRASRQVRGVTNLLFAAEPYPVIYPRRVSMEQFTQGGVINQQAYDAAVQQAKDIAKKQGLWLSTEWEDEQHMPVKIVDGILKAMRNSVSWVEVYSNTNKQKIITDVYDAFDVICYGDMDDEQKLPFMTKAKPESLSSIKYSYGFPEEQLEKLTPDNRYATSEIKNAYMLNRYGTKTDIESQASVILKETFIKEVLSTDNWDQAVKLGGNTGAMEGKSRGDQIMRQIFSAGGVTLDDSYIDYDEYPLTAIRLEPGPLYQVPFIERFIPANKSLDVIVTRLEKWVNSMVVGVYQKRKGENFEVSNFPGGQMIEYEATPLSQMNQSTVGNTPFEVIELLNKYIEEQGASTSVLGQIPPGVKAQGAIENLQQTEYSNLKIATMMLRESLKRIAERMVERAHKDFLQPVEISQMENGNANYFDVIGKRGFDLSQKLNKQLPAGIIPIDKDVKLRFEIEPGLGLTMDGKKQAMQSIIDYLLKLYQLGFLAPEAMQQVLSKFLETFGYGSTEEFMEAVEKGVTQGQMSQNQIQQMQIALAKTLQDTNVAGPKAQQNLVMASKVGTLESLKESGLVDKIQAGGLGGVSNEDLDDDYTKIYKDASPEIRRQIEVKLGLVPATDEPVSPGQATIAKNVHSIVDANKQHSLNSSKAAADTLLKSQDLSQQQKQAEAQQALSQQQQMTDALTKQEGAQAGKK